MTKSARAQCLKCFKAVQGCFCSLTRPFETGPVFVFLMHPKERRLRSATGTGRMTHLAIQNSYLFEGVDFTQNGIVQSLLSQKHYKPFVLFPSGHSINLSTDFSKFRSSITDEQTPLIFVIDGSWSCAKKIMTQNQFLKNLPALSFTVTNGSNYQFKKQPEQSCLSTLESVHNLITLFNEQNFFVTKPAGIHDSLLEIFNALVKFQKGFTGYRNAVRTTNHWDAVKRSNVKS